MAKKNDRRILIECDFADRVREFLTEICRQLSDGYWENEEGFYDEFWNCFYFEEVRPNTKEQLAIVVRDLPSYDNYRGWSEAFLKMPEQEVLNHVQSVANDMLDDYSYVFDFEYNLRVLGVIHDSIKNWKIVPPPLPKLTHAELVEIVGHDFEYVEGSK